MDAAVSAHKDPRGRIFYWWTKEMYRIDEAINRIEKTAKYFNLAADAANKANGNNLVGHINADDLDDQNPAQKPFFEMHDRLNLVRDLAIVYATMVASEGVQKWAAGSTSFGAVPIWTESARLQVVFNSLDEAPAAKNAQEAMDLMNSNLDQVEDALSGVKKNPNPGIKTSDGRMYPVQADRMVTNADGSITATSKATLQLTAQMVVLR